MEPIGIVTAVAAPLMRAHIDTDAIIPSREITRVSKSGLAAGLFAGWRYRDMAGRDPNPDFVLNQTRFAGARILLAGENFGCGSSREHAVWALRGFGFRAVVAPSFAPIFFSNSVRNGLLPAAVQADWLRALAQVVEAAPGAHPVTLDLKRQEISAPGAGSHSFQIDSEARHMLMRGLDSIDVALERRPAFERFLARDRIERPWIYFGDQAVT